MKAGCIYSRERDRNTPNNGNATFSQIEALWRKRFGLKPKKEFLFSLLDNKNEWNEIYHEYYNVFLPEYRLNVIEENNNDRDEFYSYAMDNATTSYYQIELMYNSNKLDSFQGVCLDGGRLFIPTARWGFTHDKKSPIKTICRYKYYVKGSEEYKLFCFFNDYKNQKQEESLSKILEIFLIFESVEEQGNFAKYIENNIEVLEDISSLKTQYSYLDVPENAQNFLKLKNYQKELRYALSLKQMFETWKNN